MSIARDRALVLRAVYGVEGFATDGDLDAMLADRRIPQVMTSWKLLGPLPEVYVDSTGFLRRGEQREMLRWLKAEVLAHFTNHTGDQTTMPLAAVALQERQAAEFAGWLIFGDLYERYGCGVFPVTYRLVAEAARVPVDCVERWWEIVGGAGTATWPSLNYA